MQLLRITTIPIKMKMSREDARLQVDQNPPHMKQKTVRSKLTLKKEDVKVRIDTYEARKRMGQINLTDQARQAARRGIEGALEAMAKYVKLGNMLAQAHKGVTVPEAAYARLAREPKSQKVFLPAAGAQMSWEGGTVEGDYEPAEVRIQWDTGAANLIYVPGDIKFEIEQYPDIQIEYLGSPNYVPPSANPEYEEEK